MPAIAPPPPPKNPKARPPGDTIFSTPKIRKVNLPAEIESFGWDAPHGYEAKLWINNPEQQFTPDPRKVIEVERVRTPAGNQFDFLPNFVPNFVKQAVEQQPRFKRVADWLKKIRKPGWNRARLTPLPSSTALYDPMDETN